MGERSLTLRILGESSADIDGSPLAPAATHVFAAVLVLALSPHYRVSRGRLATLLWPEADSSRQAERLRWLLSKLRGLGAPIEASSVDIAIISERFSIDVHQELDRLRSDQSADRAAALDQIDAVLPDYAPDFSAPLLRFVEEHRESIADEILTRILPLLTDARRRGDWAATDRLARATLRIAPLHEEGTLALAEALCGRGDKTHGVSVLDEYLDALGESRSDLRLPAELLRRRMRAPESAGDSTETSFVGRGEPLRRFHRAVEAANAGRGSALVLVGPAGIGKTRLLDEMAALATTLNGATVLRARWHASDVSRPLSGLTDLIPKLLELRGAAGCDPSTLDQLAQLSAIEQSPTPSVLPSSPHALSGTPDWLRIALLDLLGAVSDEQTIVIALDDFQWADSTAKLLWDALLSFAPEHRILWCFAVRAESVDAATQLFSPQVLPLLAVEWLAGLEPDESSTLVDVMTARGARPASPEVRQTLRERGGGIPLVLQELVRHWQSSGDLASVPSTLAALMDARLARLTPVARRTLQVAGLLGAYSTLDRLERVLQMPRPDFLDAIGQLEGAGILTTDAAGATQGHVLWADAAIAQIEPSVARVLHRHMAEDLEWEMARSPSVPLLWAAARHWGLSGQSEQEMAAITSGAEHFVRNRLFSEAAEAYGLALEKSHDATEQLRLLRRRIDLLRFAGAMEAMLADIDRHELLAAQLDPFYEQHNELEMLRYTARVVTPPFDRFAREALNCATNANASTSHRLHALFNCTRMAAMAASWEVMEDAHRAASDLVPATAEDFRYHWLVEMDYNVYRGDLRQSLAAARAWYAHESARGDPYMMSWSARKLGHVESHAGDVEAGRRALLESIHVARDAGMTLMWMTAHAQLLTLVCGYDPPEVARTFVARAKADAQQATWAAPWNSFVSRLSESLLLIDEGRLEEALRMLPPDSEMIVIPEGVVDVLGVRLAARMSLPRSQKEENEMHALAQELSASFREPKMGVGWHAAVYAEYLEKYRGTEAANEHVRHYMRNVRRELVPPPWRLAPFVARAMASPLAQTRSP